MRAEPIAENGDMGKIKETFLRAKQAYRTLLRYKYTTIAGTLVFFLVISILPFLFWLTLLFGKTLLKSEILELELIGWARELILLLAESAEGANWGAGVFFLAAALWSSTGFFYHLRRIGEIVYHYDREKHGWKVRVSAIALTFVVFLFCAVAVGTLALAVVSTRRLPKAIGYAIVYPLLLVFGFLAAWLLNYYVCPYRCKPRDTVYGSILTALLWIFASAIFSVYLAFSNKEKLYGAFTLVIIFLLWLYWLMICFTAGVIYNRERMEVRSLEHKTL